MRVRALRIDAGHVVALIVLDVGNFTEGAKPDWLAWVLPSQQLKGGFDFLGLAAAGSVVREILAAAAYLGLAGRAQVVPAVVLNEELRVALRLRALDVRMQPGIEFIDLRKLLRVKRPLNDLIIDDFRTAFVRALKVREVPGFVEER